MLVYGDAERVLDPAAELATLRARADALPPVPTGWQRHDALVRLFIAAASWLQGVADAGFARDGYDEPCPIETRWIAGLRRLAAAIDRSWTSDFADQPCPTLPPVDTAALPARITVRRCEGYAFYALYPELYLAAARALPARSAVIGLRSIGTGLAALVAQASDAAFVATVRPVGEPFARTLALGPGLTAALAEHGEGCVALVDEGPGLSGSSLGGAADAIEALGVARGAIRFLPSHGGDLGPQASPAHRERWRTGTRHVARFEDVILPRLAGLFADLVGPQTEPLQDLSGGAWRAFGPHPGAPAGPGREARKYRLVTARGAFLLKFVGLDDAAAAKHARAATLHAGGFAPEPLALRHGFLLERWIDARAATDAEIARALPDYLAFRAAHLPAEAVGASVAELVAMARHNLTDVPGIGGLLDAIDLKALQRAVRPVFVDARLHRCEWIVGPDGIRKTDAVDHAQAHDLVGPQDVAWDVAGAVAEYAVDPAALIAAAMPGRPEADALVAALLPCYLGFQRGWWSYAADGAAQADRYAAKAAALVVAR